MRHASCVTDHPVARYACSALVGNRPEAASGCIFLGAASCGAGAGSISPAGKAPGFRSGPILGAEKHADSAPGRFWATMGLPSVAAASWQRGKGHLASPTLPTASRGTPTASRGPPTPSIATPAGRRGTPTSQNAAPTLSAPTLTPLARRSEPSAPAFDPSPCHSSLRHPYLAGKLMNPNSTEEWGQENDFSFFCPHSSVELAHRVSRVIGLIQRRVRLSEPNGALFGG